MYEDEKKILKKKGYIIFTKNLYDIFQKWVVIEFIEKCYDIYNDYIIENLEKLRYLWDSKLNKNWFKDSHQVSKFINMDGLRIWVSNLYSVSDHPPYNYTGPRFYISVDNIWRKNISNIVPKLPNIFNYLIDNNNKNAFLQNMGWVLVPPNSTSQILHRDHDIDGSYHILWKKNGKFINTELIPFCFDINQSNYSDIIQDNGLGILFNSKLVHRGSNTLKKNTWTSSFSIELRSQYGQYYWNKYSTLKHDKDWEYMKIIK